jgi:hypothetical protein
MLRRSASDMRRGDRVHQMQEWVIGPWRFIRENIEPHAAEISAGQCI